MLLNVASIIVGGAVSASLLDASLFPYIIDIVIGFDYTSSYSTPVLVHAKHKLGFLWLLFSFVTFLCVKYRDSSFTLSNLISSFQYVNGDTSGSSKTSPAKKRKSHLQRNSAIVEPDTFNMYDPADLPLRLAEYANMVYAACEDLGNFFGFQDASVRNQAEHLLILLSNNRRYMTMSSISQPPSPIHALHSKVFSNYHKWCKSIGVQPNFSRMNAMSVYGPPAVVSRVIDLVLYFCCWGEAGNIRHMPECLWFLYHKMMEEYSKSDPSMHSRSLYAGHYLDKVVTPIYEIVCKVRLVHA